MWYNKLFNVKYLPIFTTISLEMPVPSQGHYGFHSFPVVDSRSTMYNFSTVLKMKLKKQVLMYYLKDIVIMSFDIYREILKEALATILTKTIICFGNW
jgi:hypothetical protein